MISIKKIIVILIYFFYLNFDRNFIYSLSNQSNHNKELEDTIKLVLGYVKKYSLNQVKDEKILKNVLREIMSSVDDPYTYFLDDKEYLNYKKVSESEYTGLGFYIVKEDDHYPIIFYIMKESPAYKSGLHIGDQIIEIKGNNVKYLSQELILKSLKNLKELEIQMKIKRRDKIFKIQISKGNVKIKNVKYDILKKNIGYINIKMFTKGLVEEIKKILMTFIKNKSINSIIIDLRNNPGGLLLSTIKVLDFFIKEGCIVSLKSKRKISRYYANLSTLIPDSIPIIILVNRYTASSAEIFSAVMQDKKRAWVLGEKTFGKGLSQYVIPIHYKNKTYGIKITINKIYSPMGRAFNDKGIIPDILIYEKNLDNNIEIIKKIKAMIIESIIKESKFDYQKIFQKLWLKEIKRNKKKLTQFQLYKIIKVLSFQYDKKIMMEKDIYIKKAFRWIQEMDLFKKRRLEVFKCL